MGYPDAKEAVIAYLFKPRGNEVWQGATSPESWRAALSKGGGHDADASTIQFAKQHGTEGHELRAVTFADKGGRRYRFLGGVLQGAGGWEVSGLAGGGVGDPPRDQPWVNFCGWGWPRSFRGGGWLTGKGSEAAARVRLRFQIGPTLEDEVDDRIVLFSTNARVDLPAAAEILDASGAQLATQSAF